MNTITIILSESGRIADLKKDFPLYQGSFQNKLLDVLVPTSILTPKLNSQYIGSDGFIQSQNGVYTAIKIGMIYLKRNGALETSQSYYMRYLTTLTYNGIQYALYERKMPRDFTLFNGQGENAPTLVVNVVNILNNITETTNTDGTTTKNVNEPTILEIITTQTCSLDVLPSSTLDTDETIEPTDFELLEAQTNSLLKEMPNKSNRNETVLKYNISNILPVDIVYNKEGRKSQGVEFYNETFDIPMANGGVSSETGTIMVFNVKSSDDGSVFYQDEIFTFSTGVMQRTLTLSSEDYSLIVASDWTIPNKEWLDYLESETQKQLNTLNKKIDDNVTSLNKKITQNTADINSLKKDYVSKETNTTPLVSEEKFSVSKTGALVQEETTFDIRTGAKSVKEKIAIPVTNTKARLFLVQEQESLQDLIRWQASLKNQGLNYQVDLSGVPEGETSSQEVQEYLTNLYYTTSGLTTEPLDQTTLTDESLDKSYIYYINNKQWFLHQTSISKATNNMYDEEGTLIQKGSSGAIVGSSLKFYAFVETNGEVTINGLDELETIAKAKQDAITDIDMSGVLSVIYGDGIAEIEYDLEVNGKNGKTGKIAIPIKSSDGSIVVDADEAGTGIDVHLAGDYATTNTDQEITGEKTFKEIILKTNVNGSMGISNKALGLGDGSMMRMTLFGYGVSGVHDTTAFGSNARGGYQGTAFGSGANAGADHSVAVGFSANATGYGSAQIGEGTNSNERSLQFRNYQIIDKNGKIPDARISDTLMNRISTLEEEVGTLETGLDDINGEVI